MSKSYVQMVSEFHEGTGQPVLTTPTIPPKDRQALRLALVREERQELIDAVHAGDLVEVADGIADLVYVLCGMALEFGIPLDDVFAEVHRSNMTKTIDGHFRDDGKYMKGPSYEPPDVAGILRKAETT